MSGTHTIYLTGNYVAPADEPGSFGPYGDDYDDEEEDGYDLSPDEDELDYSDEDSIDELDDMEDPRITELEELVEEMEEAPALVKADAKKAAAKPTKNKNKNKRAASESADEEEAGAGATTLDELIAKEAKTTQPAVNGDKPLSKKQLKKLKKNDGAAAEAPVAAKKAEVEPSSSAKSDKKVTFAHQLEQGPTPTKAAEKAAGKKDGSAKSTVKVVQGVTIDERKPGSGQAAKNGDRISMRYIGKLEDGKQFDSNKKGKPFSFKLGAGEVIKGWEIGVQGMTAGSERRITVPAHLAYGSKKLPGIPPNSKLIFDVKLLEIK